MRTFFALTAVLVLGMAGMAGSAWAGCPDILDATTKFSCTTIVYNDSGSDLTSGSVVTWDVGDTEFERSGYPYVTTTTTADENHVAGVLINDTCTSGSLCSMVYYGWAATRIADATDAVTDELLVGTSTVAGQAGDYTAAADSCSLGLTLELRDVQDGVDAGQDNQQYPVFVNITCQ